MGALRIGLGLLGIHYTRYLLCFLKSIQNDGVMGANVVCDEARINRSLSSNNFSGIISQVRISITVLIYRVVNNN